MSKQRIELLKRNGKGRKIAPDLIKKLSIATSHIISANNFISVMESDNILIKSRRIREDTPDNFRFKQNDSCSFQGFMDNLSSKLNQTDAYLWVSDSHFCGLVILPLKTILEHALNVIRMDNEDIYIIDKSYSFFIHIEFVHDDYFEFTINDQSNRTDFYDVSVWGIGFS